MSITTTAKQTFDGLYDVRDGIDSDHSFIYATMLQGLYYGDSWFSRIPKDVFMDNYKRVIAVILNHPTTVVKVACLPEDPDTILGYSILSGDYQQVHWVHVKKVWRNKGVGKRLTPAHPVSFTHLNDLGLKLMKKFPNTIFNPFLKETF